MFSLPLFFAVLIGGLVRPLVLTDYYVSATGNDANTGSQSAPWATIAKVNAHAFAPGNTLNFRGGDSFTGNLVPTFSAPLTSGHGFTIRSYLSGVATIEGGNSDGIRLNNTGCVTIDTIKVHCTDYNITGTYPDQWCTTTATGSCILFFSDTTSTVYPDVVINNCETTGGRNGVRIINMAQFATVAYSTPRITNCYTHHNATHGLYITGWVDSTYGGFGNPYTTVEVNQGAYLADNRIEYVPGTSDDGDGGIAIRIINTSDAVVERCLCNYSGWASTGDNVAILLAVTSRPIFRYCEVANFSSRMADGNGIDTDLLCPDAIIEHNYVHDSPKKGLFNFAGARCTYRYNIVERCVGSFYGSGGDPDQTVYVYNNVFYNDSDEVTMDVALGKAKIANNIFIGRSGISQIKINGDAGNFTIAGNAYGLIGGSSFRVEVFSGTDCTSMAALRAQGFETLGGVDKGVLTTAAAMSFTAPAGGTQQLMTNPVSALAAYDIATGSAAIGVGIDLSAIGITAPTTDWHGNASYVSTRDAGAVRSGSHAP